MDDIEPKDEAGDSGDVYPLLKYDDMGKSAFMRMIIEDNEKAGQQEKHQKRFEDRLKKVSNDTKISTKFDAPLRSSSQDRASCDDSNEKRSESNNDDDGIGVLSVILKHDSFEGKEISGNVYRKKIAEDIVCSIITNALCARGEDTIDAEEERCEMSPTPAEEFIVYGRVNTNDSPVKHVSLASHVTSSPEFDPLLAFW